MKLKLFAITAMVVIMITNAAGEGLPITPEPQEQVLVDHVHEIFKAFINRDREKIQELHADDWVGFMGPSTKIERGIDDYMNHVDLSLENFPGTDYEINDTEVQIHGKLALVFYVATYYYENDDHTEASIPLRSVDVFRHENGHWIQAASHISVIRTGGKWGEGN